MFHSPLPSGQVSINPKVETVDDLKDRRRRLHLGMRKLLQEDLHLKLVEKMDKIEQVRTCHVCQCTKMVKKEQILLVSFSFLFLSDTPCLVR